MRIARLANRFLFASLITLFPAALWAQTLFSYIDENGVRVYTNIPPKRIVQDLQVSGRPAADTPASLSPSEPGGSYDAIITQYAQEFQLDPNLIKSIIATESAFNPKAVSRKGARGLMQLMPATAARHGVQDPFDPVQNIRGGMKHMRLMLDMFDNDLSLSLAAYNAGENLVQRVGRIPQIKETHDYVKTITNRYGKKQMEFSAESGHGSPPPMFRFLDGNGTLHLTNIAPVQRFAADSTLFAQSQP